MAIPELSLVLACYDEEGLFESSCREILSTLEELRRSFEIIFVDDDSRDHTRDLISAFVGAHPQVDTQVVLHETNRGRGATVSDGFRAARGRFTGYLDIDLEVHCRYIPSLVRALDDGADAATVKRIYAFPALLDRPLADERGILFSSASDCYGTRSFATPRRATSSSPAMRCCRCWTKSDDTGWFWDTECMVRAERRGLRIVEIPGAFVRRLDKQSTVSGIRDSWEYLRRLLRFRSELRRRAR